MSEKSKKNQTIQYYDQNAIDFVENTRDVDFHVIQDEFLEKLPAGAQVLDLGCGSGILSIAALRLGAEHAFACDIDEKCVEVAYENAALNGIDRSRYTVRWGDVLSDQQLKAEIGGGYDMVVANIVADVIIGMAPMFFAKTAEGGTLICSGILNERADEVRAALEKAGFEVVNHAKSDDWSAFTAKK